MKKIKGYNEKSDEKIYENFSEKQIISDIEKYFVRYVMGSEIHSSMVENFWDEHGSQIIKCADTEEIREIKNSIEKDVNEIRILINKIKPRLEEKRDSIMREYGIAEGMVEIPISRL